MKVMRIFWEKLIVPIQMPKILQILLLYQYIYRKVSAMSERHPEFLRRECLLGTL